MDAAVADTAPAPTLTASPNPVPAGAGLGTTTITWSTGSGSKGAVCVTQHVAPEQLLGRGAAGSIEAAWIAPGTTYEFRLYADVARTNLLRTLTVTAERQKRVPYGSLAIGAGELEIQTDLRADELLGYLRRWEPWRHQIHFSNGVKTSDVRTATPYSEYPLEKWSPLEPLIPDEALRGKKALDIGFNAGYHSLMLRAKYDMEVTGIDVVRRHLEVAKFLRDLAHLDKIDFTLADATSYCQPKHFDLILHFGTLYHLQHPFLSLQNSAASLTPGGYFALETLTWHDPDDPTLCKFFGHGFRGDSSNWWALGTGAIQEMLEACGLADIQIVTEWANEEKLSSTTRRTTFLARKPPATSLGPATG